MLKYQEVLLRETIGQPLSKIITTLDLPFYFVMGKYDYQTSTSVAKEYFNSISTTHQKEFILFENSAHYPQFEEKQEFYSWMCSTFK